MKIAILGSGVVGVTAAYFLSKRGHEVTIIEREGESGKECSFANGGQLHYCHAEPWASSATLKKALKWAFRNDAPLKFRFKSDLDMWSWAWRFALNCNRKTEMNCTKHLLSMGLYSRRIMHELTAKDDISFNYKKSGVLHFFKDEASIISFKRQSDYQSELGAEFEYLTKNECLDKEPALEFIAKDIVGAINYNLDESGDVFKFTQDLAAKSADNVEFMYNTTITAIKKQGNKITAIETDKGDIVADKYILSLGAWSAKILKTINVKAPIYPLKGYSISIDTNANLPAPMGAVTDQSNKIVYSRLGDDLLRVAGTAEIAGYDDSVDEYRINMIKDMVRATFPDCGDIDGATSWACLRPSTPDSMPIIGECEVENLLLNTGHGSLGWSFAAASAKIISDIIDEKQPEIAIDAFSINRF